MYGSSEHHHGMNRGGCGCEGNRGHRLQRRFLNPKEKAARLKEYLADLKAETVEVERIISKLEQEN